MGRRLRFVPIERIERTPGSGPVFNLAVAVDESYIADEVVVHNCRSLLVPVTLGVEVDEALLITPAQLGKAEELVQQGFK